MLFCRPLTNISVFLPSVNICFPLLLPATFAAFSALVNAGTSAVVQILHFSHWMILLHPPFTKIFMFFLKTGFFLPAIHISAACLLNAFFPCAGRLPAEDMKTILCPLQFAELTRIFLTVFGAGAVCTAAAATPPAEASHAKGMTHLTCPHNPYLLPGEHGSCHTHLLTRGHCVIKDSVTLGTLFPTDG